jgi:hypothetical protein
MKSQRPFTIASFRFTIRKYKLIEEVVRPQELLHLDTMSNKDKAHTLT